MLLVKREVGTMGLLGTGSTTCRHRELMFVRSVLVKKNQFKKREIKHEMIAVQILPIKLTRLQVRRELTQERNGRTFRFVSP